jgi:2'-5' RNA ligase
MGQTSLYVALVPPPSLQAALAIPSGRTPDQIHLTLAYLGEASDYTPEELDTLAASLATFAASQSPLAGRVTATGRFPASVTSKGRDVLWRNVEIPHLNELRTALVTHLTAQGFAPYADSQFVPHITIAFLPPLTPFNLSFRSQIWETSALTLFAGARVLAFPFLSPALEVSSPTPPTC